MLIGICGKSNTGKSTFFSAATLIDVEISNRIFTTIKPNRGIGYVRTECPCKKLGLQCRPKNSICKNGIRFVPIQLIDIAGLVPGAHEGRGLGNQFLSDIMEADGLIHVIDMSGGTDKDGNPVSIGSYDPAEDVKNFELELDWWIVGILNKVWDQIKRKVTLERAKFDELIAKQLSGLGISLDEVKWAIAKTGINIESDDEKKLKFVHLLRERAKPIIRAGNKIDIQAAQENIKKLKDLAIIPVCAEAELALKKASQAGLIEYIPGSSTFKKLKSLTSSQSAALEKIENILQKYGSTGVQQVLESLVFDILKMIVVYPVASITKLSDKLGNILPDAFLVKSGTNLKEFAAKIHTELAAKFVGGLNIDKKRLGADYVLKNGDIVEILTT
jgi:ribosome-binding ATPase YchF (GTP1/OBG family)